MPTPITVGDPHPAQQRYVERWSPTNGYTRNIQLDGHNADYMRAVMAQYINSGWEVTLTLLPDYCQLEISDPTGQDPSGQVTIDTWQIMQSDEQPSSLSNQRNINAIGLPGIETIAKWHRGEIELATAKTDLAGNAPGLRLLDRMKNGGTNFVRSRYILRHSTSAPIYHAGVNIADVGVDQIYTIAQMLSETQNSSLWLLPLPPAFVTAISAISNTLPAAPDSNWQNGVLKRGASRSTTANSRQDITTEYWFGQWSKDEYASA